MDINPIIDSFEARRRADQEKLRQAAEQEAVRQRLNAEKVGEHLLTVILPVLQDAARQLKERAYEVEVQKVEITDYHGAPVTGLRLFITSGNPPRDGVKQSILNFRGTYLAATVKVSVDGHSDGFDAPAEVPYAQATQQWTEGVLTRWLRTVFA